MKNKQISIERKKYLKQENRKKCLILITQIGILIAFLGLWEILARKELIDNFITSQPSRICNTFLNLGSNQLLMHIGVTAYETIVGFCVGTILGIIIAILLWWSDFLARVADPYLVVLNSLPKVALRASYYNMGRSWNTSNNCYGSINFINCNNIGKFKWIYENR